MRLRLSNKKKQALNLNVYRNLHFRSLSAQKLKFAKIAKKLLRKVPPMGVINLHYDVCPQSKRRLDIMNIGAIVDKYFSDALTDCGVIEDDDYVHIPMVSFAFGGVVKHEHLLVTITEIEPRKEAKPMRVLLDDIDILEALTTYVGTLNIPHASGVSLDIVKGEIVAEVTFTPVTLSESDSIAPHTDEHDVPPPAEEAPKKRGRGGRPKGSKNLPKVVTEETADVDAPVQDSADNSSGGAASTSEVEDPKETVSEDDTDTRKVTSAKNLFGDKDSPSSEDDGSAEEDTGSTPKPPVKKGSIFDA